MFQRPRFKFHYRLESVEGEGVFLLSESESTILKGRIYEHLVPLIDGYRSVSDFVDLLSDRLSAAEVYFAITQLDKRGYLIEGDDTPLEGATRWLVNGFDASRVLSRRRENRVSIAVFGEVDAEALREALGLPPVFWSTSNGRLRREFTC